MRVVAILLAVILMAGCGGHSLTPQMPGYSSTGSTTAGSRGQERLRYRLVDIGTLGGRTSQGTQLNVSGDETTVIGWSSLPIPPPPHAMPIICGGSDNFIKKVTHAFQWRNGHIVDGGSLGGRKFCSIPSQLPPNAAGDFVGLSENGAVDPQTGFDQSRAVIWKNGRIHDLGSFGGYQNGGNQVNDRGQAVGFATNTVPDQYSFIDFIFLGSTAGTQTRAFLSQQGNMQDLGTLGTGNDAWAFFINRHGQVTGVSYTDTAPNSTTGFPTVDPFYWDGKKMTDLGTLGGTFSLPNAINDRDEVVGQSNLSGDGSFHPFYWNGSKMVDLGTAGGSNGFAQAINDSGEVIGTTATAGNQYPRAFVWKSGVRAVLPPLHGDCGSQAWAINSRGVVIGNSTSCGATYPYFAANHVVMWGRGKVIDVNKLVERGAPLRIALVGPPSYAGSGVFNDRGEIAGVGLPPGVPPWNAKKYRTFLLIPDDTK